MIGRGGKRDDGSGDQPRKVVAESAANGERHKDRHQPEGRDEHAASEEGVELRGQDLGRAEIRRIITAELTR